MYGHLDGTKPVPPKTITRDTNTEENPAYRLWVRQDRLIQQAILASVDTTIASMVAGAPNSQNAWTLLHTSYANKSHTRIYSLRDQLNRVTKDDKTITEYLHQVKSISDELAIPGSHVSGPELVIKIISGLGPDYREVSAAIRNRSTAIEFEELFEKLTDHELFLQHEVKKMASPISAAVATKSQQSQPTFNNNHNYRSKNRSQNFNNTQTWKTNNGSYQQSPWRNQTSAHGAPKCQLCNRIGHTANIWRIWMGTPISFRRCRQFDDGYLKVYFDQRLSKNRKNIAAAYGVAYGGVVVYVVEIMEDGSRWIEADDILVTGSSISVFNQVISSLAKRFSIKDLGELNYFLGVEVLKQADRLILSQLNYISEILHDENMLECNPSITPMSSTDILKVHDSSPPTDASHYRQVLGKLQYLSFTRPDISFSVNKLSHFMHAPSQHHWRALKRVLRYLKGTIQHGLILRRSNDSHLYMYSDADWVGDVNDRVSTTGYLLFLGRNPISWSSKKQTTVARSSTEAEYKAVASALAETT
ncbi:uncharacterized protein [Rutidosis leptorrhynchoides]|uniref:uncharacterized protein n=1 Tax=Rutidosis leptorrhynchoides TaxID=125765 RepID=UPI003A98DA31